MTREETKMILMTMQVTYTNYKIQDKELTLTVWTEMLSEYSYNQVSNALRAYITSDTSGFAPSIGQIINKIQLFTEPQELNEMQAWALVSKALRNGIYGSEEEFAKFPETVREAVGQASNLRNWAESDYETIETVIQSNFIKTYRAVVTRHNEINKLPSEIKTIVENINTLPLPKYETENIHTDQSKEVSEYVPMPDAVKQRIKEIFPKYQEEEEVI